MNNKLDMQSQNILDGNIEKIAALFPNCVTETAEGLKVDFDQLKQELSDEIVDGAKERYRLDWPGKREAIVTANLPTTNTLRPVREDSVDFDKTENLYIEGDNLEVLKILQESYLNKIKMIYIDPPYNTGKDFVYKDNFAADVEEWKEENERDETGNRLVVNPETSGRYHSDWLTMMYPRLKLARNLLTEDGVIFISIDDNEVHNLRKMCDEIFGEGNFVATIVWRKKYGLQNDAKFYSISHEYLMTFSKNINLFKPNQLPRTEEQNKRYTNRDNDYRGPWKSSDLSVGRVTEKDIYEIITPSGRRVLPPEGNSWRFSKEKYEEYVKDNRIWFGKDGDNVPSIKRFLSEVKDGITPSTFWDYDEVGHTDGSNKALKNLFNNKAFFDYPKPVEYIKKAILIGTNSNDIILDFFSGSATTAHAVMQLNKEDGGNRKFIMAQLPEATDEKSEAYKAGYKNICEIGKERIRRAAHKIREEKWEKIQKDAAKKGIVVDYNDEQDYGFRVYRLDSSNMEDVYYRPQDYKQDQMDLFADNVKQDRTPEDLLTQVMLDWGLQLSLPIERKTIAEKEVFSVAENSLYACFDEGIDEAFAKEIAKDKPLRIVFRDKGFKDDTAKENVKQLLKQLSGETEMRVI